MLGGVVGPAIIAGAVSATNVAIVPAALSTFAALTFVTLLSIRAWRDQAPRPANGESPLHVTAGL